MNKLSTDQKIFFILRIASAMCFIGHGAFGIITKSVWCNYFAVFHISETSAYQFMPIIGTMDILFGLVMLFYPIRAAFAWLVIWGMFTAALRPASGEPLAEFFERAGNYGAPFILLLMISLGQKNKQNLFSSMRSDISLDVADYRKIFLALRIAGFLLVAGHGWLNLLMKKGLVSQYSSLGFSDPHAVAVAVGVFEITAAILLLVRPNPGFILGLFIWKISSELFYPQWELFEWIERGGSYGILLSLWFVARYKKVVGLQKPGFYNSGSIQSFPIS